MSPQDRPPMERRLAGLDALRGVAAIAVALLHLNSVYKFTAANLGIGSVAVDFFFMLSGFVMARTYEQRLRDGSLTPGQFVSKRYRRLWFLMAAGTTLGALHLAARFGLSTELAAGFALALTMVPVATQAANLYLLNGPAWSVVYELVANVLHGLVFARWRSSILAGVFALSLTIVAFSTSRIGHLPRGTIDPFGPTLARVLASYLAGVLIHRHFGDRAPILVPWWLGLGLLPAFVLLYNLWPIPGGDLLFVAVCSPIIMFSGVRMQLGGVAASAAAFAGAISFPLYAMHLPIIMLAHDFGLSPAVAFAIAVIAATVPATSWSRMRGASRFAVS